MKLSNHMKIFLKGLACLPLLWLLVFKVGPEVSRLRWRLCELLPAAARASYGTTSPQLLFDYSDAVIVGTVTSSQVRRAQPQPWNSEGCRIITVYDVSVEKVVASHGPTDVPANIRLEVEGGEAWFGHTQTTGQPVIRKSERLAAFIGRSKHGRYAVMGGGMGKYRVREDGSLGTEGEEKSLIRAVFKKDMTLAELEAYPFGRGVTEEGSRRSLLMTHDVRPGLTITIPSDMTFRSGDGTDGFESQSVEWGDDKYWVGWKIPVYVICDRPDGDCDLGYMGRPASAEEVYQEQLKFMRANEYYRDTGEYWQACFYGHNFVRKDGMPGEIRVGRCGEHVLIFTVPDMQLEERERVDQVLGSFRESP